MERVDTQFYSKRLRCSAWLYLPDGKEKPPVVVMAHGFAGQKDLGLQPYAEYFAAQGMAVFLFDYRNFGSSHYHDKKHKNLPCRIRMIGGKGRKQKVY